MSEHPTSPTAFSGLFPKKQTTFDQWWESLTTKEQFLLGRHNAKFVWDAAATAEREQIAKMFDEPMSLVPFVQNHLGGCMICGFTPKMAANSIRARGGK